MSQFPDPAIGGVYPSRRPHVSGNALGVGAMLAWAVGFPAAEVLLQSWDPLALITVRFALAVGMLIPIWILLDGFQAVMTARWGRGLMVGSLAFGTGAYLLLLAQSLTDPVTVAIIASTCPVASTLLEMVFEGRRLTRALVIGLCAAVAGGIIAMGGSLDISLGLGALAATASCFLFSWGSYMSVREFPSLTPLGRSTLTLAGGLLAVGLATLASEWAGVRVLPDHGIGARELGLLAIYACAAMALSQVMFIASVGHLGVAVASFHINTAPFYVMLIMLALGGGWDWMRALGAGVVAIGVVIAQRG